MISGVFPALFHKAKIFRSCLGLEKKDAELPHEACLSAILNHEAIKKQINSHSRRFYVMRH